MKWTFWNRQPPQPEEVPDLADSIQAKEDAKAGRNVTLKALAARAETKRRNHIAEDIGTAYLILHGRVRS